MPNLFLEGYFCDMKHWTLAIIALACICTACDNNSSKTKKSEITGEKTDEKQFNFQALIDSGKIDEAIHQLELATAIDSTSIPKLKQLGDLYWQKGRVGDAIATYTTTLKFDDENADIWLTLGRCYYDKGDFEPAIKYLNNALRINKNLSEAYFWKAYAYFELNERERAISNMQTAIEQDPTNRTGYIKLGHWFTADSNDLAIDYFSSALRLDSLEPVAWQSRGNYYHIYKNNFAQARKDYQRGFQVDSTHQELLFNWGTLELETGNFSKAEELFKRLTMLNPNYINGLLGLGLSFKAQGKKDKARAAFQRILELDPKDPDAAAELTQLN